MSAEMVAVVITAILGPLLVLGISEFLRYRSAKKEREERFFYEMFPKRLALYEEIIKALDYTEDSETPFFNCNTAWELSSFYTEKCILLADFGFRCTMLGSRKVGNHLTILHGFTAESGKLALRLDNLLHNPLDSEVKEKFVNSFTSKTSDF